MIVLELQQVTSSITPFHLSSEPCSRSATWFGFSWMKILTHIIKFFLLNFTVSEADHNFSKKGVPEVALKTLEDKIAEVVSQTAREEELYQEEEKIQKQVNYGLLFFRNINTVLCNSFT